MKLAYKVMLNRLYKKCKGDILILTQLINGMKSPNDDLKFEFIEYIKNKKRKEDEKWVQS